MAVNCSVRLIKFLMFFFNFIFWLSGLTLIIVGAVIHMKYGEYFSYADHNFARAEFFIIIVGVIVFVIGFLGCCGAVKESYCMITTFAILLSIVFVLEIAAGALGYTYKKKVKAVGTTALKRAVAGYITQEGARKLMDWTQTTFKCCGNIGPRDYHVRGNSTCGRRGEAVPSCHQDGSCSAKLYNVGCKEKFIDFIRNNLAVIGAVAIAIAFIELAGIIFSCCLMRAIKNEYEVV